MMQLFITYERVIPLSQTSCAPFPKLARILGPVQARFPVAGLQNPFNRRAGKSKPEPLLSPTALDSET